MWSKQIVFTGLFFLYLLLSACERKTINPADIAFYSGPVATAYNIVTNYSDSLQTKVMVKGKLQLEYQDGDRDFPEGIEVDFYNEKGELAAKLTAEYARYEKTSDIYVAQRNVIVRDMLEDKTMYTEELRWNRVEKRVFNDRFVRIVDKGNLLTGTGFTAAQDFSSYRILRPEGNYKEGTF